MSPARRGVTEQAADAAIDQACRLLRLPTIRDRFAELADAAKRQQLTYRGFLAELLLAECDDRDRRRSTRRVKEAGFPRPKHLDDFDFDANPNIPAATIHTMASCAWIRNREPLCLIGDSGTGKSHLLIGLGTIAAQQGYRVRYTLAAKLVNELVEAADERHLAKTIARYGRVDLLCIDELGYMELDRRGAELLFQVLTEREERNSVAIASNESFSGWTKTFTDPRSRPSGRRRPTSAARPPPTSTPRSSTWIPPPPLPGRPETGSSKASPSWPRPPAAAGTANPRRPCLPSRRRSATGSATVTGSTSGPLCGPPRSCCRGRATTGPLSPSPQPSPPPAHQHMDGKPTTSPPCRPQPDRRWDPRPPGPQATPEQPSSPAEPCHTPWPPWPVTLPRDGLITGPRTARWTRPSDRRPLGLRLADPSSSAGCELDRARLGARWRRASQILQRVDVKISNEVVKPLRLA